MEEDISSYILVKKRDLDYKVFTQEIISRFKDRLEPAIQSVFATQRSINFSDISSFPNLENYVYVTGDIELLIGDIISYNNEKIIIDENNKNKFRNGFKIAISSSILDSGQPLHIAENIKEIQRLQSVLSSEDLVEYLKSNPDSLSEVELLNNPKFDNLLDKVTKPTVIEGFDVTKYSDKQIMEIVNFMPKSGDKLN